MRKNPFTEQDIAGKYESWYRTSGIRADEQEKALLKELIKKFPGARSILELGCGTGHFTRWFQETCGLTAFGMDASRAMLAEAKRYGSKMLIKGDADNIPLSSNAVDISAFITTLEFLPDPEFAIKEAYRVSKKGILLGVINKNSLLGIKYKMSGGPIWRNAHIYTIKGLRKLIRKAIGKRAEITWRTTLWSLLPGHLPLPWGGFIGMLVKWNGLERTGENE